MISTAARQSKRRDVNRRADHDLGRVIDGRLRAEVGRRCDHEAGMAKLLAARVAPFMVVGGRRQRRADPRSADHGGVGAATASR
jgi:hypothetical protein